MAALMQRGPGKNRDERAIAEAVARIVGSCLGEPAKWDIMSDPYTFGHRIRINLPKSNLTHETRMNDVNDFRSEGGANDHLVDYMADRIIHEFRKLKDDENRKRGYPMATASGNTVNYDWQVGYAAATSGTAIPQLMEHAMVQQHDMLKAMHETIPQQCFDQVMINNGPKRKPEKTYQQVKQAELDAWLN